MKIIFLISQQNICYSKEPSQGDGSFDLKETVLFSTQNICLI